VLERRQRSARSSLSEFVWLQELGLSGKLVAANAGLLVDQRGRELRGGEVRGLEPVEQLGAG
jgi:hypothetical protein